MTIARRLHRTYEEYLSAREMSTLKLEYCDGEIYAMTGGTPVHAALAARGRTRVRPVTFARTLPSAQHQIETPATPALPGKLPAQRRACLARTSR